MTQRGGRSKWRRQKQIRISARGAACVCGGVCPVKAIEPLTEVNKKGYEIIRIDEEACIGCGQCYVMCPDYMFTVE